MNYQLTTSRVNELVAAGRAERVDVITESYETTYHLVDGETYIWDGAVWVNVEAGDD